MSAPRIAVRMGDIDGPFAVTLLPSGGCICSRHDDLPGRPRWRTMAHHLASTSRRAKKRFMALDQDSLTQLLDTVERFVRERLRPIESEVAENDRIPDHIAAEMKELGLFGLSIPEEYGGVGPPPSEGNPGGPPPGPT